MNCVILLVSKAFVVIVFFFERKWFFFCMNKMNKILMCRMGNTQLQNFFRRKPQKLVLAEIRAKKVCNFVIKQLALEFSRYRFQRIFTKPAKSADFDFLKLLGEVFIKQDFWRSSFLITVHTLRCSHLQYLIARYKIKHKPTIFLIYVFF